MSLAKRKIAVIGLGYVGLPLAALCAKRGYQVTGLDANAEIVASLAQGKSHIRDDAVERLLADALASNNFTVTADAAEIADCGIYLICVPTPVDANNEPDLGPLEIACRVVAPALVNILYFQNERTTYGHSIFLIPNLYFDSGLVQIECF